MKICIYYLLFAVAMSCHQKQEPAPDVSALPVTSVSQGLDFIGVYENRCDDCTDTIRLQLSENFAYTLEGSLKRSGVYRWEDDHNILLERNGLPDLPLSAHKKMLIFKTTGDTLYKISENRAAQSDARESSDAIPPARWTLVELNGKATRKMQKAEPFLDIAANQSFTAYAGCNGIGGKFSITGTSIRFTDVVHTEMACEGATLEAPLVAALNAADNFIRNEKLLLLRKGQTVLAKFESLPQPGTAR